MRNLLGYCKLQGDALWADHMRRILVELEELKEAMHSLAEAYNSLATRHTNEIIRVLTIIATIMLPLTVVSSQYGINVRLPLASNAFALGAILRAMALIAIGMLIFFRIRRWIYSTPPTTPWKSAS